MGNEVSKGLIEPKVIPPLHSHQITEPHVGQFVANRVCSTCLHIFSHIFFENVHIVESDAASVFHGSSGVLRTKHLIVLPKRVLVLEKFFKKLKRLVGDFEYLLSILLQVLYERFTAKKWHWNVSVGFFSLDLLVRSSEHCEQICGDGFSILEVPLNWVVVELFRGEWFVGNDKMIGVGSDLD